MKKLFLLLSLSSIILGGCRSRTEKEVEALQAIVDSTRAAQEIKRRDDSVILANAYAGDLDSVKLAEDVDKEADLIKSSIAIKSYYTSEPNSAGGVDANVVWKNLSKKTVKYAYFTLEPYNAVGDAVESSIGSESEKTISKTGPIKTGATSGYGWTWSNLWYNSTITHMKIIGIELEYMDGTTISTDNESIIQQVLPKRR